VTRQPGEPYPDMIDRACVSPLGRLVKLADNWVNLTGLDGLARTDPGREHVDRLRAKYTVARQRLLAALLDGGAQ
jgi:hypothetical protein